jgi:hypothetical protein
MGDRPAMVVPRRPTRHGAWRAARGMAWCFSHHERPATDLPRGGTDVVAADLVSADYPYAGVAAPIRMMSATTPIMRRPRKVDDDTSIRAPFGVNSDAHIPRISDRTSECGT